MSRRSGICISIWVRKQRSSPRVLKMNIKENNSPARWGRKSAHKTTKISSTYRLATPFPLWLLIFGLLLRRRGGRLSLRARLHGVFAILFGVFFVDGHVIGHIPGCLERGFSRDISNLG